jgi:hypothetical protein
MTHVRTEARIEVATLLLLGGYSSVFLKGIEESIDEALPDSSIVVMPGQVHAAMDRHRTLHKRSAELPHSRYPVYPSSPVRPGMTDRRDAAHRTMCGETGGTASKGGIQVSRR